MLNFTLTDLRYLVALNEEKHFAKAARKCFVAQPTLSIAIRKLEDNLGIRIFEREKQQLLLTAAGKEIIHQAHKVLAAAEELLEIANHNQDPYRQPLKIGAILTIGPYLFPQLIREIITSIPQLQLVIEESYTASLTEKLLTGNLDVLLLATKADHPELQQISLYPDKLQLICSTKHRFAKLAQINSNLLMDETFLLLGAGNCFRDQVLQFCPQYGAGKTQLANLITTSSLETIKYMVAMNLGISILPTLAATHLPAEVLVRPFAGQAPFREISLVYRKNFGRHDLVTQIQRLLLNLAPGGVV